MDFTRGAIFRKLFGEIKSHIFIFLCTSVVMYLGMTLKRMDNLAWGRIIALAVVFSVWLYSLKTLIYIVLDIVKIDVKSLKGYITSMDTYSSNKSLTIKYSLHDNIGDKIKKVNNIESVEKNIPREMKIKMNSDCGMRPGDFVLLYYTKYYRYLLYIEK